MKWMQFFTPAKSVDFEQTRSMIEDAQTDELTILDVRQPKEYEQSHIPGATLIPLPVLGNRLAELDSEKPVLVYCAVGGRSRVAAQMLAEEGFKQVYNASGGIKTWQSQTAVGDQDMGIHLFSGTESPQQILAVAFSLEQGLEDFYITMAAKTNNPDVISLFKKLAKIEVAHQEALVKAWQALGDPDMTREGLAAMGHEKAMEGGLTTEEYLDLYQPDLESAVDVISLAMSIEAQALDLYQRVGQKVTTDESRAVILKIADEEKTHIASLGRLMEQV